MGGITVFKAKWIEFIDCSDSTKKTKMFMVVNRESSIAIGEIKWYGAWRQYAFFPFRETVYERQCLTDITKVLNHLMIERKLKKQQTQTTP